MACQHAFANATTVCDLMTANAPASRPGEFTSARIGFSAVRASLRGLYPQASPHRPPRQPARHTSNSNYEKPNKSSWYLWGMLGFRQRSRESINIGSDRCSLQAGVNMILRLCESTGEALGDFAGEMRRYAGQADRQKYAVLNA
jgi:hypothetical protein